MLLQEYALQAAATEQRAGNVEDDIRLWRLGLIGEVGSLAAVLKKKFRDKEAFVGFQKNAGTEIGDALWYVSALARTAGIVLPEPVDRASRQPFHQVVCDLAEQSVRMSKLIMEGARGPELQPGLVAVIQLLSEVAQWVGSTLGALAAENLKKTRARWVPGTSPARHFSSNLDEEEQLPRSIIIEFREKKRSGDRRIASMRVNGLNLGDRLTDNSNENDGYRFHDAFHLAHVAVLGWSPVMRSLFRCKRKSDPKKDEVDDGARAGIVEEAIAIQVFDYARDLSLLEGIEHVDQDLLNRIQSLVRGLEVEECAPWEWECAILQGYKAFRALLKHNGGMLKLDAARRSLDFEPPRG